MITLGNDLFCVIGVVLGASIMYFFEVYMDCKEDRDEAKRQEQLARAFERIKDDRAFWRGMEKEDREAEKRAEAEEYKRTHRNANKPARLISESFDTYRDGEKKKLHCKKCSLCNYLYLINDNPETCKDCGALFKEDREEKTTNEK